ncbi:MAG: ABC transporter ATP-binding protein [Bdellovibrionota bacterium]
MSTAKATPYSTQDENEVLTKRPFRFYMRKNRRAFTIGIAALVVTNLLDALTPIGLKMGIDAIVAGDMNALEKALVFYLSLMTGVMVFRFSWRVYFGRFHYTAAEDLRNRIFQKLTQLGPSFYQRSPVGALMSLITSDVNQFRMGIGPGILILLDAFVYIAFYLPLMIYISWSWTWKTLIILPFIPFIMQKLENLLHDYSRQQQDRLAEVSANAQEIVSGVRVIKSYAQERNQLRFFDSKSKVYEEACNRTAKIDSLFGPLMHTSIVIGATILLIFGTDDLMTGAISMGSFVAFYQYVRRFIWPMSAIGFGVAMIQQGKASFDRIKELLNTESDIPDWGDEEIGEFEKLELKGLTFRYPGAPTPALCDINLEIRRGETIGFVGPVGAGKTTLLQLICRMFPVEPGKVLFNGKDISKISRASLSATISYVTQDTFLFSETIAENVALGIQQNAEFAAIKSAVGHVNMDVEIESMPEGFDAYLGERGVNLSGGQKQRLTIARALIRKSQIVLLDDSLSAVDGRTEKKITEALQTATQSQTVILVSHRLATLRHADRIVVLNRGRIECIGSHEELLEKSETYRRLHVLQGAPAQPKEEVIA